MPSDEYQPSAFAEACFEVLKKNAAQEALYAARTSPKRRRLERAENDQLRTEFLKWQHGELRFREVFQRFQ